MYICEQIYFFTDMKRVLPILALSMFLLAGCSLADQMPVFSGINLDSVGKLSFAEDGKAMTSATITVGYVSSASKQIEIRNVRGAVYTPDGNLLANLSIPEGDVIVLKEKSKGTFTETVNVKMAGSIIQMFFGGRLAGIEKGHLDIDADVKFGNHRKHFSKSGIPIEEFMENFKKKAK